MQKGPEVPFIAAATCVAGYSFTAAIALSKQRALFSDHVIQASNARKLSKLPQLRFETLVGYNGQCFYSTYRLICFYRTIVLSSQTTKTLNIFYHYCVTCKQHWNVFCGNAGCQQWLLTAESSPQPMQTRYQKPLKHIGIF